MADEDRPRRGDGSRNGEVYEMQPFATTEAGVSPDVTDSEAELLERRDTTSPVSKVGDGDREGEEGGKGSLRRGINLPDAIAMVIGGIIGSGIFITPAIILELTGSFGVSMLCWVVGTAIAVCGGLCFVELALVIPRTGGQIVYLLDAFSFKNRNEWTRLLGRLLGFMYAWASIAIIRPTSLCIIVLTCTRYLTRPFYLECDIPDGIVKCLALAIFGGLWKGCGSSTILFAIYFCSFAHNYSDEGSEVYGQDHHLYFIHESSFSYFHCHCWNSWCYSKRYILFLS